MHDDVGMLQHQILMVDRCSCGQSCILVSEMGMARLPLLGLNRSRGSRLLENSLSLTRVDFTHGGTIVRHSLPRRYRQKVLVIPWQGYVWSDRFDQWSSWQGRTMTTTMTPTCVVYTFGGMIEDLVHDCLATERHVFAAKRILDCLIFL